MQRRWVTLVEERFSRKAAEPAGRRRPAAAMCGTSRRVGTNGPITVDIGTARLKGNGERARGGSMARFKLALIVGALLAVVGVGSLATRAEGAGQATPVGTPPVVRTVLNGGEPVAAPGNVLELARYTIQPGTTLPAHTHPGMQAATVEQGVLGYTVVAGTVEIRRDGRVETVGPGPEIMLHAGDGVVESVGLVHFGRNAGDEPLVILAASLFTAGEPPSHPVSLDATPAGGHGGAHEATPAIVETSVSDGG